MCNRHGTCGLRQVEDTSGCLTTSQNVLGHCRHGTCGLCQVEDTSGCLRMSQNVLGHCRHGTCGLCQTVDNLAYLRTSQTWGLWVMPDCGQLSISQDVPDMGLVGMPDCGPYLRTSQTWFSQTVDTSGCPRMSWDIIVLYKACQAVEP